MSLPSEGICDTRRLRTGHDHVLVVGQRVAVGPVENDLVVVVAGDRRLLAATQLDLSDPKGLVAQKVSHPALARASYVEPDLVGLAGRGEHLGDAKFRTIRRDLAIHHDGLVLASARG